MQQLVQKYAQGPDIDSIIVLSFEKHFWCHVLIGSAEGVPFEGDILSYPSEIADFYIGIGV